METLLMPKAMPQASNHPLVRSTIRLATIALASLAIAATGANAQTGGGAQPSTGPGGQSTTTGDRINVDFPGGTIDDFVKVVRAASGDANIITLGDTKSVRLPAFELRAVDVALAMELLNRGIHFPAMIAGGVAPNRIPTVDVDVIRSSGWQGGPARQFPAPVITVLVTQPVDLFGDGEAAPEKPQLQRTVESIGPLVQRGLAAEDILDAIQAAIGAVGADRDGTRIAFHEQTQLLMITATHEGMLVIHETLAALRHSVPRGQLPTEQMKSLEKSIETLKAENQQLRDALVTSTSALKVAREEVERMRDQSTNMMMELQATREELRRLRFADSPAHGGGAGGGGRGASGQPGQPGGGAGGGRGGAGGEGGSGSGGAGGSGGRAGGR